MSAAYQMKGIQDVLEVFEDKVTITPKGLLGLMNKGLKGTKTIPMSSITAIQFKEAGFFSGYLQFSIDGGTESKGGVFDATKDENTFMFAEKKRNAEAAEIKNYIEAQMRKSKSPQASVVMPVSLSDEIQKLAALKAQGLLSDDEFQEAKQKLIS